jgi:hypothetical protein
VSFGLLYGMIEAPPDPRKRRVGTGTEKGWALMNSGALFGLSVLMNFVASGIVAKLYIWPRLRAMSREEALPPLVLVSTERALVESSKRRAEKPRAFRRSVLPRHGISGGPELSSRVTAFPAARSCPPAARSARVHSPASYRDWGWRRNEMRYSALPLGHRRMLLRTANLSAGWLTTSLRMSRGMPALGYC